jgi:DNA-binding CsgD family transcriptional regulator
LLFDFALDARAGASVEPPSFDLTLEPFNWHAAWRTWLLELRRASLTSNHDAAGVLLDRIRGVRSRAHPAVRAGLESFVALSAVERDPVRTVELMPPPAPSLLNLAAAFAGAEALAIAGEVEPSVGWLRWLAALPSGVHTSLEWPVARWRVQGLLEVRLGDTRGGIASLRRAIQWSTSAGYELEAALAQLQLAEVMELGGRNPRLESRHLRQRARGTLEGLGIDFTAQAYAATRVVALGRATRDAPRLSSRELEVLTRFARGLDYRGAAADLGISWRTVQTHAVHAYAKLGAPNRAAALMRAKDLALL